MAAWGNNFFKKIFFLPFFHFSAPLKCHWPIRASSLKSHSPAGRIYSPLATGRVLMKRLWLKGGFNAPYGWHTMLPPMICSPYDYEYLYSAGVLEM